MEANGILTSEQRSVYASYDESHLGCNIERPIISRSQPSDQYTVLSCFSTLPIPAVLRAAQSAQDGGYERPQNQAEDDDK